MGVSTLDEALRGRAVTAERLPEYHPPAGQRFMQLLTYRSPKNYGNWFGRKIGRHIIRFTAWLSEMNSPAPFDLMGLETTPQRAEAHVDDSHWSVIAIPVGATFPKERVSWFYNYMPRRWNYDRERVKDVALTTFVNKGELDALVEFAKECETKALHER